jgi:hypothetical protein
MVEKVNLMAPHEVEQAGEGEKVTETLSYVAAASTSLI